MTDLLRRLTEIGFFSSLDFRFAMMLSRVSGESNPDVLLGAALAAAKTAAGDVCADIPAIAGKPVVTREGDAVGDAVWPQNEAWIGALRASALVSPGDALRPLVLAGASRLYLHRQYQQENELAGLLSQRAASDEEVDETLLSKDLDALFGSSGDDGSGQRFAAKAAAERRLTVIAGGPGSGKTTTVLGILLILIRQFQARRMVLPVIEILAPTGKAAQRLGEAVRHAKQASMIKLGDGGLEIAQSIPERASTIHRLLANFETTRRQGSGLLSADVVVIDEASMADLSLMHSLLSRIKPNARVIIVGDKDQLASVESGAVLADIFDAAFAKESYPNALSRCVIQLTGNYRFDALGGIGRLARAVNEGRIDEALDLLKNDPKGEVSFIPASSDEEILRALLPVMEHSFGKSLARGKGFAFTKSPGVSDAFDPLEAIGQFCVLTPHRRGALGQEGINRAAEEALSRKKAIVRDQAFYVGRPIMVTKNDYAAEVFNGDMGQVIVDEEGCRVIAFPGQDGLRKISPSRLKDVETAYAMTVHKSQGSEFDRVAVVVPNRLSPVMVRELLYTAITRAKSHLTVIGSESGFRAAVQSVTRRASGLKDRLLGG